MTTISPISEEAQKVRKALIAKGIETPTIALTKDKSTRRAEIQAHFRSVMELLGLDLSDDSLEERDGITWVGFKR